MATTDKLRHFLSILHYLSPIVIISFYLLAATVSICTLQSLKASRIGPRQLLLWLMSSVLVSYIVEACMLLTDTMTNDARFSSTDSNVSNPLARSHCSWSDHLTSPIDLRALQSSGLDDPGCIRRRHRESCLVPALWLLVHRPPCRSTLICFWT